MLEAHGAFLRRDAGSFVCESSGFLSRKMTWLAWIFVFQRFWPDSLSSHSEVRREPSMSAWEPFFRYWEAFSPLPFQTTMFSQFVRSCFSPAPSFQRSVTARDTLVTVVALAVTVAVCCPVFFSSHIWKSRSIRSFLHRFW